MSLWFVSSERAQKGDRGIEAEDYSVVMKIMLITGVETQNKITCNLYNTVQSCFLYYFNQ